MSNLFEIIDAIRLWKGYTLRDIAQRANMPYTTLASLMKRRSNRISISTLQLIASGLGMPWEDLLPFVPQIHYSAHEDAKIPTKCSVDDALSLLHDIIGYGCELYLEEAQANVRPKSFSLPDLPEYHPASSSNHRDQFKQSMNYLFDKLNDEGLLEAMRRIVDLAQDSKYCISTEPNKKEDTEWQEKEL